MGNRKEIKIGSTQGKSGIQTYYSLNGFKYANYDSFTCRVKEGSIVAKLQEALQKRDLIDALIAS